MILTAIVIISFIAWICWYNSSERRYQRQVRRTDRLNVEMLEDQFLKDFPPSEEEIVNYLKDQANTRKSWRRFLLIVGCITLFIALYIESWWPLVAVPIVIMGPFYIWCGVLALIHRR